MHVWRGLSARTVLCGPQALHPMDRDGRSRLPDAPTHAVDEADEVLRPKVRG